MIPESFKQDLLNRVDIVEVVSRVVQLKKGGANLLGLCPFHNEKSPSFTVSPAKQFYHCFGCGAHGNAIGFLMSYSGLGYVDAVKDLASTVGLQVPEEPARTKEEAERRERQPDLLEVMESAMEHYRTQLKRSQQAIDYLKSRGVSGEIAARFRIGFATDDWQGLREAFPDYESKALVECGLVVENEGKRYDRFRNRVMFPIHSSRGTVIGFGGRTIGDSDPRNGDSRGGAGPKYLNSPETPLFEKGREVYGLIQARDAIRETGRILVVEGYLDVIALAQFGIGYAVATLGTATTPVHVSKLLRLADELVFCFDGDEAGRKAAWRALDVSLALAADSKPVRFLFLPRGDDPDTYVRAHGNAEFDRLVREAQTLSEFLLGEIRAKSDLSTAEGRSRILTEAKPLLQRVNAQALKLQLVKAVADLAQVTQAEAETLLELRQPKKTYERSAPARAGTGPALSLEWKILTRVLAKPALALEIDVDLLDPRLEETGALLELIRCVGRHAVPGELSDGLVAEMARESPHASLLANAQAVLRFELKLDEDDAVAEFREMVAALRKREPEEVRILRQKVLKGLASPEELRRYRDKHLGKPAGLRETE